MVKIEHYDYNFLPHTNFKERKKKNQYVSQAVYKELTRTIHNENAGGEVNLIITGVGVFLSC